MKIGFKLIIALSVFVSSVSFAGAYTGSQNISSVSSIIVNSSGYGTYFAVRGSWPQADKACPSSETNLWIVTSSDIDEVKSMYSLVLAAYSSNTKIEFYQDGCVNGRPKAVSAYLPSR